MEKQECENLGGVWEDSKYLRKPLYHGTRCDKIDSIKKSGLTISSPIHLESREIEITKDKSWPYPPRMAEYGVYLTKDLDTAVLYAHDASKDCPPEFLEFCDSNPKNMCVVVINKLPKNAKLGSDGYGDLMTDKNIPPESISDV